MTTNIQDIPDLHDTSENNAHDRDEASKVPAREVGGPKGPEPTRYGDWERKGRCIDF